MGKYADWKYGECECSHPTCPCARERGPACLLVRVFGEELRVCPKCFRPKEWAGRDLRSLGGCMDLVRVLVQDDEDPRPIIDYDPRAAILIATLMNMAEDEEKASKQANLN